MTNSKKYMRKWRQDNPEKCKKYSNTRKEYYQKNKEKISQKQKEHYQKNRDIILEKQKDYYQKNKEKRVLYYQKNRKRELLRVSKYQKNNKKKWFQIIKEHFGEIKCQKCGYNKNFAAIDFHHKNSTEKEIGIGKLFHLKPKPEKIAELEKCQILCKICHYEFHFPECFLI